MRSYVAYAPFGESFLANLQTGADYSFAGLTQDTFTVNPGSPQQPYDTVNRELHPVQGRWLSPDPAGLNAVSLLNPQSWNRYAYAVNNPLSFIDPTGLECVWDDGSFDSKNDPVTGSASDCGAAGGNWFDPTDFANRGLGDWSPNPNADLAAEIANTPNYTFQTQVSAPMPFDFTLIVDTARHVACNALPQGRVTSLNGSLGIIGGQQGSVQQVVNYNNGEVSNFATGGVQLGLNGGVAGSASMGLIFDTHGHFNNSDFSGPFQNVSASAPEGPGGSVSWSNGVKIVQGSFGANLIPGPTVNYSYTWTSKPRPGGNIWTNINNPLGLFDLSVFSLRRAGGC